MDANIAAAIIAGIVSLIIALATTLYTKKQWEEDFLLKIEEPKISILEKQVERRFQLYPPVFESLGAVRDYDPLEEHHESLKSDPAQLLPVASNLLKYLYSEPGLFMSYETRNQLLVAWWDCQEYSRQKVDLKKVINDFYFARRYLRADLQLDDIDKIKSELQKRIELK